MHVDFSYVKRIVPLPSHWYENDSSVVVDHADESLFCRIGADAHKDGRTERILNAQLDADAIEAALLPYSQHCCHTASTWRTIRPSLSDS